MSLCRPSKALLSGLTCAVVIALSGCDYYAKPNAPLPSNVRMETLDGQELRPLTLRGKPWVVVLWVPGCGICASELPILDKLRLEYEARGVGFLALSIEPDQTLVRTAAQRLNLGMLVATTRDETLGPLSVNKVPSTVFVDATGTIIASASGARSESLLRARVRSLLDD